MGAPNVSNPANEYFKDGIWAWDAVNDVWLKLDIDPTTRYLRVSVPGTVEVVQDTAADLNVLAHGYDGSAARKLPMLFGYTDGWIKRLTDLTAAAGENILDFGVVPAGEVWVLNAVCMVDVDTDPSVVSAYITNDGETANCFSVSSPGAGVWTDRSGWWVLPAGAELHAYYGGCTLNDDLYCDVVGFKMDISM